MNNGDAPQVDPEVSEKTITEADLQPSPSNTRPPNSRWRPAILIGVMLVVIVGAIFALMAINQAPKSAETQNKYDIPLLRVGIVDSISQTIYPQDLSNVGDYEINSQIFEGLTQYVNGTRLKPALADSWTTPDSTTWVFNLRSNVKFHTGKTMTATDVKASLDAAKGFDYNEEYTATIDAVTAKDSSTVEIKTTEPDPLLANKLTKLFIYDTTGKPNDSANGTGPYAIKAGTTYENNSVQLSAVDTHHGGHVAVRELHYTAYDDEEDAAAAYADKKIDFGVLLNTAEALEKVESAGAKLTTLPANAGVYRMVINTLKPGSPLAKLEVREAIAHALNREELIKARGRVGATPATQLVTSDIPGYDASIKTPAYDVNKAKALLSKANYASGFNLTLTYFESNQPLAEELKKELAVIGIVLDLDPQTDGPTLEKKALSGQTDLYLEGYSSDFFDASDVLADLLAHKNYKNAAAQKLLDEVASTLDQAKRLEVLQKANAVIAADIPAIPLFTPAPNKIFAGSSIVFNIDSYNAATGVRFWKVYSTTK